MNDFLPIPTTLASIRDEIDGHRRFLFAPAQPVEVGPGQFVEITLPGVGAFPVSASTWPTGRTVESCIRQTGRVTTALFGLREGAEVGLRGPFGNGFPVEAFQGRDVLLVAGGLGMAPLRALLHALLFQRSRVGTITLLYGSRAPERILFRKELEGLAAAGLIALHLAVDADPGRQDGLWRLGTVQDLLAAVPVPVRASAAVCGPPALYAGVLEALAGRGLAAERVYATLERRMRCGIGECCHCVTGGRFVCTDGPVFTLDELRRMEGALA